MSEADKINQLGEFFPESIVNIISVQK